MSHLSVLPTVLRDCDGLVASLRSLGLEPLPAGELEGFAGDHRSALVRVRLADGLTIGWARQGDGSLALVGDLQRLSRSRDLPALISRINRAYASHQALAAALGPFPAGAQLHLDSLQPA